MLDIYNRKLFLVQTMFLKQNDQQNSFSHWSITLRDVARILSLRGLSPWRARAYNGGLGTEPPAGSRGRAPGQGVRGRSPSEAESILVIGCPTEPANLAPVRENSMFCYGPLVSELGGPEFVITSTGPQTASITNY